MTRTKETAGDGWILGGLALPTRVVLAPMAGYTDLPFRRLVRSYGGVGLAYSEMLHPDSLLRGRGCRSYYTLC